MFEELLAAPRNIIGVIWFEAVDVIDWKVTEWYSGCPRGRGGRGQPRPYQVRWKPRCRTPPDPYR